MDAQVRVAPARDPKKNKVFLRSMLNHRDLSVEEAIERTKSMPLTIRLKK